MQKMPKEYRNAREEKRMADDLVIKKEHRPLEVYQCWLGSDGIRVQILQGIWKEYVSFFHRCLKND